jgi:hypothetical protein
MELLSVVAILKDVPEEGIVRGQVGTLVESLAPAVWLVEFSDTMGRTRALIEVREEEMVTLHYELLQQVA